MGGRVSVTYRKDVNQIYKMSRWTNPLPFFTTDFDLHSEKLEVFEKKFLSSWLEMKKDYDNNKDTQNYELNMTGAYFPFFSTYPDDYGLVVIDAVEKKIMSLQGYSNLGVISGYNFFGVFNKTNFFSDDDNLEELKNFEKLYNQGFLKNFISRNKNEQNKMLSFESLNIKNFGELKEYAKTVTFENKDLWYGYIPIHSAWKIERFSETPEGVIEFKQALDHMGYQFNLEEEQGWLNYINRYSQRVSIKQIKEYKTLLSLKII